MWEYIPPLPRMLASRYEGLTSDEIRVMARYGIRSPSGLKLAMKKYGATNIDDLVLHLEHHRPRRRMLDRLKKMFFRGTYGTSYHPHAKEISRAVRTKKADNLELERRIKRAKR